MRWYYRRIIEIMRYEGPHFLLLQAMTRCIAPIGQLGLKALCQKDLTRPLEEIRAKVDITVSRATEADIEQLTALVVKRWGPKARKNYDILRDDIRRELRRGSICFVGKIGTEIIHYNWIFFRSVEPLTGVGPRIQLNDGEVLCDDAYTEEAWRGKAIHTAIQYQMLLFLKKAGYRRIYTPVGVNNKSSQKTHRRLGWEFTGTMLYFIPRGAKKAWIWRIKGTLEPFC
jgi:hypothetical protein